MSLVPYAPKGVKPSNATTDSLELSLEYYSPDESQCTHFEVSDLANRFETVPKDSPAIFSDLIPDTLYNFSTYAISNYTQETPPSSSNLWQISSNSTPSSAWTCKCLVVIIIMSYAHCDNMMSILVSMRYYPTDKI